MIVGKGQIECLLGYVSFFCKQIATHFFEILDYLPHIEAGPWYPRPSVVSGATKRYTYEPSGADNLFSQSGRLTLRAGRLTLRAKPGTVGPLILFEE